MEATQKDISSESLVIINKKDLTLVTCQRQMIFPVLN